MTAIHFKDQEALNTLVSEEFSDWSTKVLVDQELINKFADVSDDTMWMHVDVERCAKESPFGCTIAHGFLLLSLLTAMKGSDEDGGVVSKITGFGHMMNYGSDKLRFLGAVTVDSEVHSRSRVKGIEVTEKKTKVVMETHVHAVGSDKPALIYELMFVFL